MKNFRPLSAIRNRGIVDPNGEHVGRIHDVLFDLRDGRIEYICIALDAGQRRDRREVVVPWSALRIGDGGDRDWQVAARKQALEEFAQPVQQRSE